VEQVDVRNGRELGDGEVGGRGAAVQGSGLLELPPRVQGGSPSLHCCGYPGVVGLFPRKRNPFMLGAL
jgi:hypothetical protein